MADNIKITSTCASIEADLSVIMQFLRVASTTPGYEMTPAGIDEICGMIFAVSLRVSNLWLDIQQLVSLTSGLEQTSRAFVETTSRERADIADLVGGAKTAAERLHSGKLGAFRHLLDSLDKIERLVAAPSHTATPAESNVVQFPGKSTAEVISHVAD